MAARAATKPRDAAAAGSRRGRLHGAEPPPTRAPGPPQVIGNKWDTYLDLLQADYTEGWVVREAEAGVAGAGQPASSWWGSS